MSDHFSGDTPADFGEPDDLDNDNEIEEAPAVAEPAPADAGWVEGGAPWHGDGPDPGVVLGADPAEPVLGDDDGPADAGHPAGAGDPARPTPIALPLDSDGDDAAAPLLPLDGPGPTATPRHTAIADVLAADAAEDTDGAAGTHTPGERPGGTADPNALHLDASPSLGGDDHAGADRPDTIDALLDDDLLDDSDDPLAPIEFGDAEREVFASLPDDNGSWNPLIVAAAIATATGVAVHAVTGRVAANRRRRGHDASVAVGLADELGMDACIEHGNIERLRSCLQRGGTVLFESNDGAEPLVLVDCGPDRILVEPLAGGARRSAPLTALRAAWADTAGQLVSIEGGERPIVVLPVMLPESELLPVPP